MLTDHNADRNMLIIHLIARRYFWIRKDLSSGSVELVGTVVMMVASIIANPLEMHLNELLSEIMTIEPITSWWDRLNEPIISLS